IARRYVAAWPQVEVLLLFQGGPGTGKGHLAWSLAKAVVSDHGGSARVVKLARLIRDLREPWRSKEGAGEERRLRAYRVPDLLVIDEVSRHAFYGQSVQQHLYDVLDDRLEHQRPTILTTNETDAGIAEILGPALLDRLQGSGGVVRFGDASWRTRPLEATA
ncbi:MAG: ATP-binding protein, partial [Gemmatimonadetes bacterium]|nr:ATP-binding protein [Gemmatimonadota bacterium]